MLKILYTVHEGIFIERLEAEPGVFTQQARLLALALGQQVSVRLERASFLVRSDLSEFDELVELTWEETRSFEVCAADADYAEVTLVGTWLGCKEEAVSGIFLAAPAEERVEKLLQALWRRSSAPLSRTG